MIMRPLILLFLLCSQPASGGSNTTYNFLRSDVGARGAAMAGSIVSLTDDPIALFYNPAGLSTLTTARGSLGFFKHLLDINAGYLSYAEPIPGFGSFATGIIFYNYGTFEETDDLGNVLGSFGANDIAFSIGFGNSFEENFYYGVSSKLIYSQIAGFTSAGLGADIGLLYTMPESRATVGVSVRNIGIQVSQFFDEREDLPLDVVIGGSVVPKGIPLLLSVNFHQLNDAAETIGDRFKSFSVGGEFTLGSGFQIRFGYDNVARKDLKIGTSSGLAGFSGGVGFLIQDYRVDYALSSLGKVGNLHRVTIGTTF